MTIAKKRIPDDKLRDLEKRAEKLTLDEQYEIGYTKLQNKVDELIEKEGWTVFSRQPMFATLHKGGDNWMSLDVSAVYPWKVNVNHTRFMPKEKVWSF
jgi:hypothetical protein